MAVVSMSEKLGFLRGCSTGHVADAYIRMGMDRDILAYTVDSSRCRPLRFEDSFIGSALTVRFSPPLPGCRGMGMLDVLAEATPGSVVMMTGVRERCFMGDVLARYAASRKLEAMVAEGFIRDSKDCMRAGIPVFSQGGTTAAKGNQLYRITEVNAPLDFHGIVIHPGDIVMGDCDGIIRIPLKIFDVVFEEVQKVAEYERQYSEIFAGDGQDMLKKLKAVSEKSH